MGIRFQWCWFLMAVAFQLNAQQSADCRIDHCSHKTAERELIQQLTEFIADSSCTQLTDLLLAEESRLFQGRGSKTIHRIRAWSYVQLARDTTRHAFIQSYAVADLSNSINAYVLSGIAKAILDHRLLLEYPDLSSLLERAIRHIRYRDKPITFEVYFPTDRADYAYTNARELLQRALEKVSSNQTNSCCSIPVMAKQDDQLPSLPGGIELIDQAGNEIQLVDFIDRPTVVVFFYTRCENPYKCSATITRLGALQRELDDQSIRLAGITYDPWYDKPEKIRKYGQDRGVRFGQDCRLFTYDKGHSSAIQAYFDLKVNYESSLVTIHAAEVFVLDGAGQVLYTNNRQDWQLEDLVAVLDKLGQEEQVTK